MEVVKEAILKQAQSADDGIPPNDGAEHVDHGEEDPLHSDGQQDEADAQPSKIASDDLSEHPRDVRPHPRQPVRRANTHDHSIPWPSSSLNYTADDPRTTSNAVREQSPMSDTTPEPSSVKPMHTRGTSVHSTTPTPNSPPSSLPQLKKVDHATHIAGTPDTPTPPKTPTQKRKKGTRKKSGKRAEKESATPSAAAEGKRRQKDVAEDPPPLSQPSKRRKTEVNGFTNATHASTIVPPLESASAAPNQDPTNDNKARRSGRLNTKPKLIWTASGRRVPEAQKGKRSAKK